MKFKKLWICFVVFMILLTGCAWTDHYIFYFEKEIDDYFEIHKAEDKELYIREGNLDFAKVGNIVIVPDIKAINHTEYAVDIYAYSLNENEPVFLKNLSVSTKDEVLLLDKRDETLLIEEWRPLTKALMFGSVRAGVVTETDEWFYRDNQLQFTFQIVVGDEQKEATYNAELSSYKAPVFPT